MPAAADELLFKSLTGHPRALDHTLLGCMTKIFHLFEGHPGGAFMGRRSSSSTRLGINNIDSGRSQHRTQADSQPNRHDRRNRVTSSAMGDRHEKTVQPTSHHRRSYSDITDMAATPSRTFSGDAKPACSYEDKRPACSEGTRPAYSYEDIMDHSLAFNNYESLRAAAIVAGDSRRRSDLSLRGHSSNRSLTSSSPNRTIPKGSSRQQQQLNQRSSSSSEIRDSLLATFLPETGARSDLSRKKSNGAGSRKGARSNISNDNHNIVVFARGLEPCELLQWKDGLRSSERPAPKGNYNKSPSRSSSTAGAPKLTMSHHSSPERRVDPPKKKNRQKMSSLQGTDLNTELQESPGASYFRESLKPFMTGGSQDFVSRLNDSNSGRSHSNARDTSVNVIARLMGLEENVNSSSSEKCAPLTSKAKDARLSRGDKFFRGLVQFDPQMAVRSTSPPPFCQTKKHDYNRMQEDQYPENYPEQYNMEQKLRCYDEDRDYEHSQMSKPFLSFEHGYKEPPNLLADAFQAEDHASYGAAQAEIFPGLLMKQSAPQKKKMLWKIIEAMRPKGLLKMSRRKQQTEPISTDYSAIEQPIQQVLETQQHTVDSKSSCGLEEDELSRNTNSVQQVQEQRPRSSNSSTESSIVKRSILPSDESTIEVTKPVHYSMVSENNVDIFRVRQVETATSNSNEEDVCQTMRAARTNNEEDCNLGANGQRKATKSRAALEDATPSTSRVLESHCEITDPSSGRKSGIKADNAPESRQMRTATTTKPSPNFQGIVSSDTARNHRQGPRASSPELSRPMLSSSKSTPRKDCNIPGRKSLRESGGKKDAHPKAQVAKQDILKRTVSRAGAKRGAVRLKKSNIEGAVAAPPKVVVVDVSRPSTTEPDIILDTSGLGSNSDVQSQSQPSDSELLVCKTFEEPHVYLENQRSEEQSQGPAEEQSEGQAEVQSEVQTIEDDCVGDLKCHEFAEPSNSGVGGTEPDHEPQTSLQILEAEMEASEDLSTPRGVKLNCEDLDHDNLVVEEMDRPSPVSVLDPTAFDEELTSSPTSSSKPDHVVPIMQDSTTTHTIDEEHEANTCFKDLEADEETPPATFEDNLDLEDFSCDQAENIEPENCIDATRSYALEPDEGGAFFVDPEMAPSYKSSDNKVTTISDKSQQSTGFEFQELIIPAAAINDAVLQTLYAHGAFRESDHKLWLHCLEEIMERILLESQHSAFNLCAGLPDASTALITCKGRKLEQELRLEMQNTKAHHWNANANSNWNSSSSSSSDDVCAAVQEVLLRNLLRCHGRQWGSFSGERESVGVDVESMIVGELIEEAVGELCDLEWNLESKRGGEFPLGRAYPRGGTAACPSMQTAFIRVTTV